jgi:hypothetical protein
VGFERPMFIVLAWREMVSVQGSTDTYSSGFVQVLRQVISIVGVLLLQDLKGIGLSLVLKIRDAGRRPPRRPDLSANQTRFLIIFTC